MLFFAHSRDFRKFNLHFVAKHSENRMQKAGESAEAKKEERERVLARMRGNERAPLETFVASVSFSYFFQIILFRPMQAAESVCVCVWMCVCVCRRESPCAMRS